MKIASSQIENYIKKIAQEKIVGCVLFGFDMSLIKYRFDAIAKQIAPDLSDPFLVTNISRERLADDHALLSDEFFSLSMLGGRKLILIRDVDNNTAEALKLLMREKHVSGDSENFILINGGDLDKNSAIRKLAESSAEIAAIACYEDGEFVIKKFIAEELRKKKINFDETVANALFARLGTNRQMILMELEKIDLFLADNRNLTAEIVANLSGARSEIAVNDFIANFTTQKFDTALIQVRRLLDDGMEPIALLRFLGNYFQKLYQAKQELDCGDLNFEEVVKKQRLFFKVEDEFRKALRSVSPDFIVKSLREIEAMEVAAKSGKLPPKILLVNLVLENCRRATK